MGARRPNLQARAAQQAKRADVVCVQAVDQKSAAAHNHLQSLCWDRLCARWGSGDADNKRGFFLHWMNNTRTICFRLTYEAEIIWNWGKIWAERKDGSQVGKVIF